MKKIILIILLMVIHAITSFALFANAFALGMNRFDTGKLPSIGEKLLNILSTIFLCPLMYPLSRWGGKIVLNIFPGKLGYIPLVLNSFIWALAIYWIIKKLKLIKNI